MSYSEQFQEMLQRDREHDSTKAEIERLARVCDNETDQRIDAELRARKFQAENEAMRAVVDAALLWEQRSADPTDEFRRNVALVNAVRAYREARR